MFAGFSCFRGKRCQNPPFLSLLKDLKVRFLLPLIEFTSDKAHRSLLFAVYLCQFVTSVGQGLPRLNESTPSLVILCHVQNIFFNNGRSFETVNNRNIPTTDLL